MEQIDDKTPDATPASDATPAPKVKRGVGRPRKENMPTPVERQREYRKCPEFREKHRLRCANYNARMKKMREFCKQNNIEV